MELSQEEFEELFTIKECLGEGTFGSVNSAICKSNGLKYAVKQIPLGRDMNHLSKALKEAGVMQKIEHKNLIKCTYVGLFRTNNQGG